jgi:hypothetical protein
VAQDEGSEFKAQCGKKKEKKKNEITSVTNY